MTDLIERAHAAIDLALRWDAWERKTGEPPPPPVYAKQTADLINELADEVKRLRELTTWLSIDMAPQDRVELLLGAPGSVYVGSKREGTKGEPQQDGVKHWRASCCGRMATPTHFLPLLLPPPPAMYARPFPL
jgi:hypothetical protein